MLFEMVVLIELFSRKVYFFIYKILGINCICIVLLENLININLIVFVRIC